MKFCGMPAFQPPVRIDPLSATASTIYGRLVEIATGARSRAGSGRPLTTEIGPHRLSEAGSKRRWEVGRLLNLAEIPANSGCQGRSKSGPLVPVENWATCSHQELKKCTHLHHDGDLLSRLRSGARRAQRADGSVARRRRQVLVAQPVGVALEREDLRVVDEPVDHRDGGHLVTEDLAP